MNDSSFWNEDWMKIQKDYWENWTEMSRQAAGLQAPPKPPWESAMEHWWQAVAPSVSGMPKDFMEKMLDQGKALFHMGNTITGQLTAGQDWAAAIDKTMADMQKAFEGSIGAVTGASGSNAALSNLMGFWEMPMDNWQRMTSSLSLMPGDVLRNFSPHGHMDRFLSAPGLGYTREEEEQYKDTVQCAMNYQKALGEYAQFFSRTGILSVERMKQKIQELMEGGGTIDSARGLYDLWISACEEVYGEQVMAPEYARIHGHLVNALMELKQRLGQMVDTSLGALNMPTRREIRTLQDRLQETRREDKALYGQLELLKEQVMQLKNQVAQLQATATGPMPASRTAPISKRSPRKKTAKKKTTARRKTTD